ncbi:MAG: DUF2147 domain-containing protein [Flavipsychrobacter sp.]|nr:DUF2147 domain-containing protein [Flavipsychrobacter sp.]
MRKCVIAALALLISAASLAQGLPADKIIGTWESVDASPRLRFEFYKQGSKYLGRLLYASNMYEADGKTPKRDHKNPDPKLRSRSRYGITNITGLEYEEGEYTGGTLYNPEEGRTYSVKAKLKNADELDFRGYVGISLLGKTMKFRRIQ